MDTTLYYLVTLATFAVLIVLIIGLWTMLRGRSPNLSQKLMRWRVGLQFGAIILIMIFIFFTR